ncbi:MAG: LamG-like jellyroll fold domain-containing protein [Verrucomicrobiales bacterium]
MIRKILVSRFLLPAALIGASSLSSFAQTIPEPIFYVDFEEGAGSTVTDLVNGNVGTMLNFPLDDSQWVEGAPDGASPGGGIVFDSTGSDTEHIGFPTFPIDETTIFTSDYTIAAWLRFDGTDGFFVGQNSNGIHNGVRNAGKLATAHWGSDNPADTTLTANEWVHAVWTFSYPGPRPATGESRIYLNGVEDRAAPFMQQAINEAGTELLLGSRVNDNGDNYAGVADDVAIWNVVLTQEQITALANGAKPFSPTTGEDEDNDGMDDGWEVANGLDPTVDDSALDPDEDNLANLDEWAGGDNSTNPQEPDSDLDGVNDDVEVLVNATDPNNPDSDADGLNDGGEVTAMTDPHDPDSDDDTMPDGYEVDNMLNPLVDDAGADADSDLSLNLQEFERGTDPNVADTDIDGLNDNVETGTGTWVSAMDTGTDPLDPDTDDDLLLDGSENNSGAYVDETMAGSDPHVVDTDGDGTRDGSEVIVGRNPVDPSDAKPEGLGQRLVNLWSFDEESLTDEAHALNLGESIIADDGSFDGGDNSGITFSEGLFDGGISLDGAAGAAQNNGYVRIPRSLDTLAGANGSTITTSMWVRMTGIDTNWQTLISHGEGNQYRIARRADSDPPIASYAGGAGDIPGDNGSGPPIGIDNVWHHIVAISEGGVSTRLWVDNMLVATGNPPTINDAQGGSALDLLIGANPNTGGQNREWFGEIDDVAQWFRVLTEEEVGLIHQGGLDGQSLKVLLGAGGIGFQITSIVYDADTDEFTMTWPSKEGESFAIFISPDMTSWDIDLDDGYPADVGQDFTTYTFSREFLGNSRFIRVEK